MQTDKSERSLSPLSKDPLKVGKLFKPKRTDELNPEATTTSQILKEQITLRQKSPKDIGINTSRTALPTVPIISKYNIHENELRPVTHMNINQQSIEAAIKNDFYCRNGHFEELQHNNELKEEKRMTNKQIPGVVDFPNSYHYDENQDLPQTPDLPNRTTQRGSPVLRPKKASLEQKSEPGLIRHQYKSRLFSQSAPKDFGVKIGETQSFHISSPELPYINKLENNINGFRKFMNGPSNISSSSEINSNNFKNLNEGHKGYKQPSNWRKSLVKNIGEIVKRNDRSDPQEEQKLSPKKSFRISNNSFHTNRAKLPTFRQQNKEQYELQVDLDRKPIQASRAKQQLDKSLVNNSMVEEEAEYTPGTLFSNSFIKNTAEGIKPQNILIIDLRTSIQKIKQALIEGGQYMAASFNIPQVFYRPPTTASTSQDLHMLMLEVFSFVGINPQIVSIKKYINCVVMRQKKLSILWNFNGKIYFGGWKKQQTLAEGNKDGIGVEWVPSRYIYYGEFKDNKKEGYGIMKKANKEIYIGCWKNNQRWGWGKVYDPEGNLHQNGEFIEGCFIYPQKGYQQMEQKDAAC